MAPTYDFAHAQQAKSLSKAVGTGLYPDTCGQRKRFEIDGSRLRVDADIFESEKNLRQEQAIGSC